MTRNDILLMAKGAGLMCEGGQSDNIELFAMLIAEECARICNEGTIEKPMGLYYSKQIKKQFGLNR